MITRSANEGIVRKYPVSGIRAHSKERSLRKLELAAFHRLAELGPINNVGPLYFNLVGRIGVTVCYCMTDLIQYFKSGNNVAKDSIFTVLRRNWPETDIKLAAVRKPFWIYVVGKAAHCHRAAHMF